VSRTDLSLRSLGAASTVTGSKHLLESDGKRILLDCGLFQGVKNLRELNWAPLAVEPESIDAVVVTHAHLDHTGYLPRLVRDGFRGPIVSTAATAAVAEIILRDSAYLQERDAAFLNKHKASKHHPALPLYDSEDARKALELFTTHPFGAEFDVPDTGATVTFRRAGHILGASTVDVAWRGRRIVFTGDLGRYDDPIMFDPEPVTAADYLVMESTYGDRVHEQTDPADVLAGIVETTVKRGGTVVVPAFAVGRAQTLLYYLWLLREDGRLPDVPVYLDSPMAINASELLGTFRDDHRLSPEVYEGMRGMANYTPDSEQSMRISASTEPKIVISASGMATGGRILHHLKAFAPDARNTIMITGSIWERVVFGRYLFARAFFWEDVFSMLVLALHTAYLAAIIWGIGTATEQMVLVLAAYGSYAINATQFILKLRAARLQDREMGAQPKAAAEGVR